MVFDKTELEEYEIFINCGGWSGGAIGLGKLPVQGRPTVWMIVGQGPIALAGGAGGWGLFGHFYSPLSFLSSSPSVLGTARYRRKYCLKGPLSQKQTNKQTNINCETVSSKY